MLLLVSGSESAVRGEAASELAERHIWGRDARPTPSTQRHSTNNRSPFSSFLRAHLPQHRFVSHVSQQRVSAVRARAASSVQRALVGMKPAADVLVGVAAATVVGLADTASAG